MDLIEPRLVDRVMQRTTEPDSAKWAFLMLLGERLCTVEMCEQSLGEGSDWDPEVAALLILDDATWNQRAVTQGHPSTLS